MGAASQQYGHQEWTPQQGASLSNPSDLNNPLLGSCLQVRQQTDLNADQAHADGQDATEIGGRALDSNGVDNFLRFNGAWSMKAGWPHRIAAAATVIGVSTLAVVDKIFGCSRYLHSGAGWRAYTFCTSGETVETFPILSDVDLVVPLFPTLQKGNQNFLESSSKKIPVYGINDPNIVGRPLELASVGDHLDIGDVDLASTVHLQAASAKPPSTTESIALISAMDTLIGHQVNAFDRVPWEHLMRKYFSASDLAPNAPDMKYWYAFPEGSKAWQFTVNPYTASNPANPRASSDAKPGSDNGIGVVDSDSGLYPSIDAWFYGEHIPWNVAFPHTKFASTVGYVFTGTGNQVMCLLYALAWFKAPFKGIPHLPTLEFLDFLEQETRRDGADGNVPVRREFWLKKYEYLKYTGQLKRSPEYQAATQEQRGFMGYYRDFLQDGKGNPYEYTNDATSKNEGQTAVERQTHPETRESPTPYFYDTLVKTLYDRPEFGQTDELGQIRDRHILPLEATIVDLDFYVTEYIENPYAPDSSADSSSKSDAHSLSAETATDGSTPLLRILYNACMGDLNSMLVQTGRRLLHNAVPFVGSDGTLFPFLNSLEEGHWENPRTMSGDPAPQVDFVDARQTARNLRLFTGIAVEEDEPVIHGTATMPGLMHKILGVVAHLGDGYSGTLFAQSPDAWSTLFADCFTDDGYFYGNPWNLGRAKTADQVHKLLEGTFGMFENRRLDLVDDSGNDYPAVLCKGSICGLHGFLVGTIREGKKWLGVKAEKDLEVRHRLALFVNLQDTTDETGDVVDTKIKDAYLTVDLIGSAMQLGLDMIKVGQEMV